MYSHECCCSCSICSMDCNHVLSLVRLFSSQLLCTRSRFLCCHVACNTVCVCLLCLIFNILPYGVVYYLQITVYIYIQYVYRFVCCCTLLINASLTAAVPVDCCFRVVTFLNFVCVCVCN